jgi:hypothetical protein
MLNKHIDDALMFSPVLDLTGWNPLMNLTKIIDQLTTTYGCPTPVVLLQNDTLFQSTYSPGNTPKVLF